LEGVKMARKKRFVTHGKATRELGYLPGSIDTALQRAIDWFRANGYC
jgi:dihydroflavonol-4-reductase